MLLRPGGTGGTGGSTGGGSGGDGGGGGSGIGGGGGGGGGALSPWEKLVVSHACPKLNERLVAHPRLRAATQSLPLLLETLTPERKQAALALLRWLPSLPEGACDALLRGPSSDARGETATWRPDEDGAASPLAALVCDEGCLPLLRALLSREPRLAQPALVAALSPSRTFFYRSLLHRCGLALGSEAIALLLAPRGTDALTSWDQLVLHGPWPLVRELMDAHSELRQAALRSSRLLAAAVRTPLGCVVALRLIELGAPIDGSLEARLLEHDTSLSAFGRGRRTGGHQRHPDVVAVRGLDEGHSQAPILGLYVASHEHVTRLKVAYHKGSHDERRLVYRQVGGTHALWFKIDPEEHEDEDEEEDEEGDGADPQEQGGEGGGAHEEEEEEDDDDFGGGGEPSAEDAEMDDNNEEEEKDTSAAGTKGEEADDARDARDGGGAVEEAEEPEEQEGCWVITDSDAVGAERVDDARIAAKVVDVALQPQKVVSSVWSVAATASTISTSQPPASKAAAATAARHRFEEVTAFTVQSANSMSSFERLHLHNRDESRLDMLALLVESEACDPLLLALLKQLPSLRAPAVVRALDATSPKRFEQLTASAGLEVGEAEVELLLTPYSASASVTQWLQMVSRPSMWPLVGLLMDRHPRLRAAAREPAIVLTALRSPVAALQLLEKLDAPLDDGLCASIRAWQRLPALVGATHKPECVRLLDVLGA
jgi:hypothetical protein